VDERGGEGKGTWMKGEGRGKPGKGRGLVQF